MNKNNNKKRERFHITPTVMNAFSSASSLVEKKGTSTSSHILFSIVYFSLSPSISTFPSCSVRHNVPQVNIRCRFALLLLQMFPCALID